MRVRGLLTLLIGLLLTVGCTHDSDIDTSGASSVGRVTTVKISATLPDFGGVTRGYDSSNGGTRNIDWNKYELRIIVKAYGDNSESEDQKFRGRLAAEVVDYIQSANNDGSISIDLDLPLTSGHTYDVYLWADYVLKSNPTADLHYDTSRFPTITLTSDALVINDESRDAFFARNTAAVGDGAAVWSERFNIERAVAKLRMVATDAESAAATMATLQMDTFYGGFNIAEAKAINKATGAVVSDKTEFETYSTESAPDTKSFITAYMLWPASANATIVANFYEEDKADAVSEIAPTNAIPLKRGNLTTLRGVMFESGWDGTTLVEPMTIDGDWLVLNNAKELAWVLETGDTKEKNKIRITSDMDMGGHAVNPFPVHVSDFDGNNKSITNIVVDGNSLFTIDKALSIHDLNVDTITVGDAETVGHVGVLLDEVKLADGDNVTYSNVTISNASVSTTNGAAGGLIGYIGRADEKNRNVTYTVTIENCELTDVTAAGSLSEGHLVGLFSGYDNGETLIFKDNNTIANANTRVDDYVSHYTSAQQSCWLAAIDAKYDGMLGNEVYHRGTIYFGDKLFVRKWDGETKVEPLTEGGALAIYSAFDMAKLPDIEATSVKMMADVDMGNGSIATLKNSITAFDGNNKSIHNIAINGNALFAKSGVAVQKLTIDGATIGTETTTGNVGVLFSEIRATGTVGISDITVRNATLKTTNGCAGGIVGYVGRTTENARNTSLTATFTRCHGANITSDTAQHVGQLVGQFGGYDSNETLAFSECTSTPAAGYTSIYRADQQSCWRTAVGSTSYDGILGAEKYYRGTIMFGDIQFSPKWDGETKVVPLTEDGALSIYSPFDLANLQQDKNENGSWIYEGEYNVIKNITFKTHIDLGSKTFIPIYSLKNLNGGNFTLYNLKVDTMQDENKSLGGAFIRSAGGGTHKDLIIRNADVRVVHDPNGSTGNAYGGIFCGSVSSTQTMSNIQIYNSKLYAVCKMGGLVGRVHAGSFTCNGCVVDNCELENYNAKDDDVFDVGGTMGSITAKTSAVFGTSGEAGGLIGFINVSANITGCSVSNTKINCFGQRDQEVKINATLSNSDVGTHGYFLVAGRHVNQFIGDIRTIYTNTSIVIDGCSVTNNQYGNNSVNGDNGHLSNQHNNHFYKFTRTNTFKKVNSGIFPDNNITFVYTVTAHTPFVGCVYYVGIDDSVLGIDIRYGDVRGKVTINNCTYNGEQHANITLDDINEFVGGPLNNIGDADIKKSNILAQVRYPSNAITINDCE